MPRTKKAGAIQSGTDIRIFGMTLTVTKTKVVGPYAEMELSNGAVKRIYRKQHVLLA